MLSSLRKGAASWVAKIFISILILSFAVWGVEGLIVGSSNPPLAEVGDVEITRDDYQKLFPVVVQEWNERLKAKLTRQQIRAFDIPSQVKYRLINQAAVDHHVDTLNLGVSDKQIGEAIKNDPQLKDNTGQFNKELLRQILRSQRISEQAYFNEQRTASLRTQITSVFTQEKSIPDVLVEGLYHYREDKVDVEYFIVPTEAVEKADAPLESQLETYYEKNKTAYVAPEYRKVGLYTLSLDELIKGVSVTEDDLKTIYKARLSQYKTPALRQYSQIVFETMEKAIQAHDALKKGDKFEDVAKTFGKDSKAEKIGPVTEAQMADPKLAKAIFSIKEKEYTAPIEGRFAITIAQLIKAQAAEEKTLEQVRPELEKILKEREARKILKNFYDKIEDLRASGMKVDAVAKEMSGTALTIDAIDAKGNGKDGKKIKTLPNTQRLLTSIFDAAVGDDTLPVRHKDGGYVWFDVFEVVPSHQKAFKDVIDDVRKAWLADKDKELAIAFANKLAKEINDGKAFADVAKTVKAEIKKPNAFGRGATVDDIPVVFANRLFGVKAGETATGLAVDNKRWIVAKITNHVPAKKEGPAYDAYKTKLVNELQSEMTNDLVTQYLEGAKKQFGVQENNQVFEQLKTTF